MRRARGLCTVIAFASMATALACNAILGIHEFDDAGPGSGGVAESGAAEASFDAGAPPGEAGTPVDGAPDVPLVPPTGDAATAAQNFPNDVIVAYCKSIAACCNRANNAPFLKSCQQQLGNNVGTTYLALILNGLESRHYAFDPARRAACIADIDHLGCMENPAAAIAQMNHDCASAYIGLLGEGDKGCASSFDCKSGLYCGPVDATGLPSGMDGLGTCTKLEAPGKPCSDTTYSSDCTYLGLGVVNGGDAALFCDPNLVSGGLGDGGVCTNAQPNGTNCYYPGTPQQCTSQLCVQVDGSVADGGFACEGKGLLTNVNGVDLCTAYAGAGDAGDGG